MGDDRRGPTETEDGELQAETHVKGKPSEDNAAELNVEEHHILEDDVSIDETRDTLPGSITRLVKFQLFETKSVTEFPHVSDIALLHPRIQSK
jgi:hypothetical protein